jgi:hypothetical protein
MDCHSKPCPKNAVFYVNAAFISASPGSFMMPLRDFRNSMPISNSEQWTAGNSGLPGLNGYNVSSFYWDPLIFPIVTLSSKQEGIRSPHS